MGALNNNCFTDAGVHIVTVRATQILLHKPEPSTFGERIATAFISALAAALTLLAYFVLNAVFAAKSGSNLPLVPTMIFSKLSAYIICAAALAGFLIGSARMVNIFSVFWGTNQIWEREWFRKLFLILSVAFIVLMILLRT